MYVHEGNIGTPYSRLFRSDDVATGTPAFTDLTSANPADAGYATYNQCGGQCWYDLFVPTPRRAPGHRLHRRLLRLRRDRRISNGRGVVLSTDAGVSGTDMTMDGTDPRAPQRPAPRPARPRHRTRTTRTCSSRPTTAASCAPPASSSTARTGATTASLTGRRAGPLPAAALPRPARLIGMNDGLNTLQFISLSVSPHDSDLLQGGTQDNGTWQNNGNRATLAQHDDR